MSWKVQPPGVVRRLFKGATWRKKEEGRTLYLTFDDGPVEKETSWVMNVLKEYGIQATFFCVGENAHKRPEIIKALIEDGHSVGNHAYNHLPAWKCSRKAYFDNIEKARPFIPGQLFRPPHGQLYPWYMNELKRTFSEVVMWDVLTEDYDNRVHPSEVLQHVKDYTRDGSILVFHDSQKAWDNLSYALPHSLDWLLKQGYQFKTLDMGLASK